MDEKDLGFVLYNASYCTYPYETNCRDWQKASEGRRDEYRARAMKVVQAAAKKLVDEGSRANMGEIAKKAFWANRDDDASAWHDAARVVLLSAAERLFAVAPAPKAAFKLPARPGRTFDPSGGGR